MLELKLFEGILKVTHWWFRSQTTMIAAGTRPKGRLAEYNQENTAVSRANVCQTSILKQKVNRGAEAPNAYNRRCTAKSGMVS